MNKRTDIEFMSNLIDMEHFGTSQFNEDDLNRTALYFILSAYTNKDNAGDEFGRPPTNHWTIYLQTDETASVKLDITPGDGPDGLCGSIFVESKTYVVTNVLSGSLGKSHLSSSNVNLLYIIPANCAIHSPHIN